MTTDRQALTEPDPEPEEDPDETALLSDPAETTADLTMIESAVSQGWGVPESVLHLMQKKIALIACGQNENGRRVTSRDQLRAAQLLTKMKAASEAGKDEPSPEPVEPRPDGQPPWIVGSLEEVGEFFRRSREAVKDWREKGMPGTAGGPNGPGVYDLSEILIWKESSIGSSNRNDDGDVNRAEAERRKAVADAGKKEWQLEQLQGQLIYVDDVIREYRHHATHCRALFEQVPDRLLPALPEGATGEDQRKFLKVARKVTNDAFDALYRGLGSGDGEEGKAEDMPEEEAA